MNKHDLFPLRMLGFGFYWAWLFLVCVSPSLLLEQETVMGLSFESTELFFRLVFIAVILLGAKRMTNGFIRKTLFTMSLACGLLSSALAISGIPGLSLVTAALLGATDACMFILWMCFFGNNRIGEVALYVASSYAFGAAVSIFVSALARPLALGCALVLPVFSCATFYLSYKHYRVDTSSNIFEYVSKDPFPFRLFPYIGRISVALCLYALVFGMLTSTIVSNGIESYLLGPFVEAPCCLVVGVILAIAFVRLKDIQSVYQLYRLVPSAMSIGFAALLFGNASSTTFACFMVISAYLVFEILALNDLCNKVKLQGLSVVSVLGVARAAITLGMLCGWLLGLFTHLMSPVVDPLLFDVAISVPLIVVASTLVFTEKEVFAARSATDERKSIEEVQAGDRPSSVNVLEEASAIKSEMIEAFGGEWGLSNREMEVLPLLLSGKTASYISEKLYVAPGTVKTHIYNIYRKMGIHSKMEMFDLFELYREQRLADLRDETQ